MTKTKVKKYTEEQLSMVLSHAEELEYEGEYRDPVNSLFFTYPPCGCVNQVAYNEPDPNEAAEINPVVAQALDSSFLEHYDSSKDDYDFNYYHTPDSLLKLLERVGAA